VKLPPTRSGGAAIVVVAVGLLAAVGGMAIYAGLHAGGAPKTNAGPSSRASEEPAIVAPAAPNAPEEHAEVAPPATPPAVAHPTAAPVAPPTTPAVVAPTTPPTVTPTTPPVVAPTTSPVVTRPTTQPVVAHPTATSNGTAGDRVTMTTTPAGATVFVDGELKGTTPGEMAVAPGKHVFVVLAEGQKMVKREIEVAPGGKIELTLEPAKLTAPVAGGDGLKVRCKSHGEIRIFVDGQDSGRTCPNDERISVAPGPHKLGLYSARTGETHELDRDVAEGNNSTRVYVTY
jgi:hypothetical protein